MTTVIETIPEFFFYLEHQKMVTAWTIQTYKLTIQDFCSLYGLKQTKELNGTHIIKFKKHISTRPCKRKEQNGFSQSTIYVCMGRLKAYLKRMYERGLLENVKPSDVPINKMKHTNPTYLTKDELKLVFKELDKSIERQPFKAVKRDYIYAAYMIRAMAHLLYATWLRNAELRRLKPDDVDIRSMRGIVIGKGDKQNNFTFNEQAKKALQDFLTFKKRHYKDSPKHMTYLFTSANFGTPITATGLNIALKNLWESTGLSKKLHAHVFRHSCATALLNNGVDIRTVQQKLCHVSIETTAIYLHITDKQLQDVTGWLVVY